MNYLEHVRRVWKRLRAENKVEYICGGGEALPQPLSVEEEGEMLRLLQDEGECERAKAELIQRNLRLVVYIA